MFWVSTSFNQLCDNFVNLINVNFMKMNCFIHFFQLILLAASLLLSLHYLHLIFYLIFNIYIHPSVCLFIHLSIYLPYIFICFYIYLCIYLYIIYKGAAQEGRAERHLLSDKFVGKKKTFAENSECFSIMSSDFSKFKK